MSKPLYQKLGIKKDFSCALINKPKDYQRLTEAPFILNMDSSNCDFVHIFCKKRSEMGEHLRFYRNQIKQEGCIWASWLKKSSKVESDITEDVIRELAFPLGLVDIKVCSVDSTWSALKLVIRKSLRNKSDL